MKITTFKEDGYFLFVGMTRFELATSGPPDRCATGLRHSPNDALQHLIAKASAKVVLFFELCKFYSRFIVIISLYDQEILY